MTRVLLINQKRVPHYRVPVYGYLGAYLLRCGFSLTVVGEGIEPGCPHPVDFQFVAMRLSTLRIATLVRQMRADIVISWVNMKNLYLFPVYFVVKALLRKKMIYWGQGRDLLHIHAQAMNLLYRLEQSLCDAIILYAEHLKKYVPARLHRKVFVANNTLFLGDRRRPLATREETLERYGIHTRKNVVCMGRMQKRKRIDHVVEALAHMERRDIGLILVGPDTDGELGAIHGTNIFKVGPIYGDEKYDLLSAADVYCLPGAIGLGVVDALNCGLPIVTEYGDESAERMYVRDGVNGFVVARGDTREMACRLQLLLDDDALRRRFSDAARREMAHNGHIDRLCEGFRNALRYVSDQE